MKNSPTKEGVATVQPSPMSARDTVCLHFSYGGSCAHSPPLNCVENSVIVQMSLLILPCLLIVTVIQLSVRQNSYFDYSIHRVHQTIYFRFLHTTNQSTESTAGRAYIMVGRRGSRFFG